MDSWQAEAHLKALDAKSDGALGPEDIQKVKQHLVDMANFLMASAHELQ